MDTYITGATIKSLREKKGITQAQLAKEHFISFVAHLTSDRVQLVKFYPEGNAETRLSLRGGGWLYFYCNKHGLMKKKV